MLTDLLHTRGRWLAAVAGALLPLCFAPFGNFWLAPVLLALLFACWQGQSPAEAGRRGFWFGAAAFAGGTYWLYISIHGFGGAPAWLAVALMLGLVGLMAAYVAATGWLAARLAPRAAFVRCCVAWPAAWVLVEWLRGWLFSGFPWLSLGYGQLDGPLQAWGPVLGVYGLSWLVASVAGVPLVLWRGRPAERLAALLLLGCVGLGSALLAGRAWTWPAGDAMRVALVQGSIPQDRKWLPAQRQPTLELYRQLSFSGPAAGAGLVIWPEVAVPALDVQVAGYLADLGQRARAGDREILLGIMTYDAERERFFNSLLLVGAETGRYDKRHLVPFGEYFPVPGFIREWMRLMSLPYRDAAPGPRRQPPLLVGGVRLAPSICYEDAFGAEQRDFLPAAGLLVNVSNDAWFGDSIAPHQHLEIARMRALETGRYLLRATNTGITALIGPDGRVLARAPQFETRVLAGEVVPYAGATPFVRLGNWPVVLWCLAVCALAAPWRRRG